MLDTNIYCGFAAGLPAVVNAIIDYGQDLFLPAVVMGELCYGFLKGTKREYNEKKLAEIIRKLQIGIIDITGDVARKYALIYLSLIERGRKIPLNDVWIAACCMEIGGTLLTMDKHFSDVNQIEVIILNPDGTMRGGD
ncbi:type II toxin-antitoxin system VapC family toxin [candidate division CSSED10-310 bacterium]|uniref:Type II toxin-antitoxin system VapC family toxin n=1 Tax=candidate division CSSED10-310 bacterium TaxID=2855610 RepID=A0ABV6YXR2_UNCC1